MCSITIPLRDIYVKITDGDVFKALLLNQLVYWSKRTKDAALYVQEEKDRLVHIQENRNPSFKHGWIYKSYAELNADILNLTSDKTVERRMKELIAAGIVFVREHPNPRDNRKQYRVNLSLLYRMLQDFGAVIPEFEDFGYENAILPAEQHDETLRQNDETLTEITSLDSYKNLKNDRMTESTRGIFETAILPDLLEVCPKLIEHKRDILLAYNIAKANPLYNEVTFVATLQAVARADIKQSFLGYLLSSVRNNLETQAVSIEKAKNRIHSQRSYRKTGQGSPRYMWVEQRKVVDKTEQAPEVQERITKMEDKIAYLKQSYGIDFALSPIGRGVPLYIWLQVNEDRIEEKLKECEQEHAHTDMAEVERLLKMLKDNKHTQIA